MIFDFFVMWAIIAMLIYVMAIGRSLTRIERMLKEQGGEKGGADG